MEIQSFFLFPLRNEEHFQFQTEFNALVIQETAAKLKIEADYALYTSWLANEAEALDLIRKNTYTTDLIESDAVRDTTFRGLADMVKAALNHFNPDVKQAAARVQVAFNHYGNIARKSNSEETAAITSIVADLRTQFAAEIVQINITEWIDELERNNNAYDLLSKSRYSEDATKTQLRMKEVRVQIDESYNTIVKRINALIIVNGDIDYISFVNEMNQRIAKYKTQLAQRKGRNAKPDEVPTDAK